MQHRVAARQNSVTQDGSQLSPPRTHTTRHIRDTDLEPIVPEIGQNGTGT